MGWRLDSDIQQMLRESAQGYLGASGGPAHFREVRETASGFDAEAWRAMAELGWTGILLPEGAGGSDLGMEPALTIAEELGRAVSPEPFVSSAVITATILAAAQGEAAAPIAAEMAGGQASATLAWQESTGQVGAATCATRLDAGRLTGRKLHVPGWHPQVRLLVWAHGEGGDVIVLVDPASAGVNATVRRMSDGSLEADLDFAGVAIADEAVILSGKAARVALDAAIARGTLALCAQLEGLAGALWQLTADHIKQRVQFDQPLADFQVIRHRMVDLYADTELAAASWRKAARALEDNAAAADAALALHAAKARCSQTALDLGRWAIQFHGAMGFTDEVDVGLYVHAALRWASWLGNAPAHRRLAFAAHRRIGAGQEG